MPSLVFCNYVILGRHILNISRNRIFEAAILSVTEKWTTWSSFLGIWYTFKVCNESLYLKELQCVFIKNNRWFLLRHACFGEFTLILFRMGFFGAAHGCGGAGPKSPHSLKSVTHIPQWWHWAQLYLTQRRSIKYMNHVTHPLSSGDISIFSLEINKFCYIKKYRYTRYFDT